MDIHFDTVKLESLCLEEKRANKELGKDSAKKLRTRLSEIEAASNVTELIAGKPHPLKGDRKGQFSLSLAGGNRLVFKPSVDPPPETKDGGIDWVNVKSVIVIFIGDYHD